MPEMSYHASALLDINLVTDDNLIHIRNVSCDPATEVRRTNGKLSGSIGLACTRNSSLQLSRVSKLLELLTS
jgi:hypothetical protein